MFFKRKEVEKKRRGGAFGILRLVLSFLMVGVLLIGLYLAMRQFSGFDPLKVNLGFNFRAILTSDQFVDIVSNALSANPKTTINKFIELFSKRGVVSGESVLNIQEAPKILYKFAVVSDSHNDNQMLKRALVMAKEAKVSFVVGLGDFSDVGTIDELTNSKIEFDGVDLPYYVTAGDHDLWDSRNRNLQAASNFTSVFGSPYSSFEFKDTRFIIIYNADNYLGLDGVQLAWIEDQLSRARDEGAKQIFVLGAIPLFHPSSDHVMGKTDPKLGSQAQELISMFKKYEVSEILTGDTHFYARYSEPGSTLKMTTVGAITSVRNLQAPRFAVIDVYEDQSYNIQDLEVK